MNAETRDAKDVAASIISDEAALDQALEELSQSSRVVRQSAASALREVSLLDAKVLAGKSAALIDALNRPEAQTRWNCLDALTELVPYDSRACEGAIPGAETALFDEGSGLLRLSAMRFLCTLGSTTANRSQKVWPLIDEAIQCYHGDLEFQDMLAAVSAFSAGKLSPEVKAALADRMRFDAENSKGSLKRRAQQIIDNVS